MVDENFMPQYPEVFPSRVQIPLWSMKTKVLFHQDSLFRVFRFLYGRRKLYFPISLYERLRRSDSSMVDENCSCDIDSSRASEFRFLYGRWKPWLPVLVPVLYSRSDSSMVDENQGRSRLRLRLWLVQIPLWSMKTYRLNKFVNISYPFRFLYGRWKLISSLLMYSPLMSSDSSMVDENCQGKEKEAVTWKVQIPLWSMKTITRLHDMGSVALFRFLYGRWKLRAPTPKNFPKPSSDSSMVDENSAACVANHFAASVQIPLWSMKTRRRLHGYYCWLVQIPLWSMKTIRLSPNETTMLCSDSSMVDENCRSCCYIHCFSLVQIPLWSMKTYISNTLSHTPPLFRFLYGRWKRI